MSIHEGHRQRLKNRFLQEGLEHFSEHEVLELMLFHCIPRQDTNPIAHALIEHFDSFYRVLEATPEELKKVPGISTATATYLSMQLPLLRYYQASRDAQENIPLTTIEACGKKLTAYFEGLTVETVYLLCLDAKCKMLCCKKVGEGSVNSAAVPVRKIVEMALGYNASSVVLAHNHPSGVAVPSREDIFTTRRVAAALDAVEVVLADHIIVADGEFVSMADSGVYRHSECIL